jgi:hypothetical protein
MEPYIPFIRPDAPDQRLDHVHAGVARTDEGRHLEWRLKLLGLLTVSINAPARLDLAAFRYEAAMQLRLPRFKMEVSRMAGSTFLLHFEEQHERNAGLQLSFLEFGVFRFRFMPWTRQVSSSSVPTLLYRVHLCIEGVPAHLRHLGALVSLFPQATDIDDQMCDPEKPEEECARLWLWIAAPNDIAITGTLQAEEPVVLPKDHYADGGAHLVELGMPMGAMRLGAMETLDYAVILHVDRVLDFSALPVSGFSNRR